MLNVAMMQPVDYHAKKLGTGIALATRRVMRTSKLIRKAKRMSALKARVINKFLQLAAVLLILGSASTNATANLIYTDTFPSASSTRFTQIGSRFWNAGDFVEQQFTATGITRIDEFSLGLNIGPNSLNGDTQDMDVLINGIVIGSYQINPGDTFLDLSFTGLNLIGTGDYLVRLLTTRTVTSFAGSAGILDGAPGNLVLTQFTTVAVPEPGALGLLAFGLAGLGFAVRRRQS